MTMQQANMTIDGATLQSDMAVDVINPATGEAFAQCYFGTEGDVDKAVAAANAAFPAWSSLPDEERKAKMMELAGLL